MNNIIYTIFTDNSKYIHENVKKKTTIFTHQRSVELQFIDPTKSILKA